MFILDTYNLEYKSLLKALSSYCILRVCCTYLIYCVSPLTFAMTMATPPPASHNRSIAWDCRFWVLISTFCVLCLLPLMCDFFRFFYTLFHLYSHLLSFWLNLLLFGKTTNIFKTVHYSVRNRMFSKKLS